MILLLKANCFSSSSPLIILSCSFLFCECKKIVQRKLISNKAWQSSFCVSSGTWFCIPARCCALWAPLQVQCLVARCTMKSLGWLIKGPIETQPRAGQKAVVWTVETWHPPTEAYTAHSGPRWQPLTGHQPAIDSLPATPKGQRKKGNVTKISSILMCWVKHTQTV